MGGLSGSYEIATEKNIIYMYIHIYLCNFLIFILMIIFKISVLSGGPESIGA